ncbi:hypothetical protein OG21DRAFT_258694 [Imleria badia]|nr:hypothetical protein OG21DRAFT_258694 [Imleria badia]
MTRMSGEFPLQELLRSTWHKRITIVILPVRWFRKSSARTRSTPRPGQRFSGAPCFSSGSMRQNSYRYICSSREKNKRTCGSATTRLQGRFEYHRMQRGSVFEVVWACTTGMLESIPRSESQKGSDYCGRNRGCGARICVGRCSGFSKLTQVPMPRAPYPTMCGPWEKRGVDGCLHGLSDSEAKGYRCCGTAVQCLVSSASTLRVRSS